MKHIIEKLKAGWSNLWNNNSSQTPYTRSQGESPSLEEEKSIKRENKQDLAINHLTDDTSSVNSNNEIQKKGDGDDSHK